LINGVKIDCLNLLGVIRYLKKVFETMLKKVGVIAVMIRKRLEKDELFIIKI